MEVIDGQRFLKAAERAVLNGYFVAGLAKILLIIIIRV